MEPVFMVIIVSMANILGGAVAIPQAARLVRHRRVEGVSTMWAGTSIGVNAWWIGYGFGAGESSWAIIPVGVISVAAYLVIATSLVRYSNRPRPAVLAALALPAAIGAVIPVPALILGGWPATGIILGGIYGLQLLPAVYAIYKASDLTGVSVATWIMTWTEAVLWGIYGLGSRDPGILTFAATGLLMSSAVFFGLLARRPPTSRAARQHSTERPGDQIRT